MTLGELIELGAKYGMEAEILIGGEEIRIVRYAPRFEWGPQRIILDGKGGSEDVQKGEDVVFACGQDCVDLGRCREVKR